MHTPTFFFITIYPTENPDFKRSCCWIPPNGLFCSCGIRFPEDVQLASTLRPSLTSTATAKEHCISHPIERISTQSHLHIHSSITRVSKEEERSTNSTYQSCGSFSVPIRCLHNLCSSQIRPHRDGCITHLRKAYQPQHKGNGNHTSGNPRLEFRLFCWAVWFRNSYCQY